jgi:hypothetical protein
MLAAVEFDYYFPCGAIKVNNVWPKPVLPEEFQATKLPVTDMSPEELLGIGLIAPQVASTLQKCGSL